MSARVRSLLKRLGPVALLAGAFVFSATCGDQSTAGPDRMVAPGHALLSFSPSFQDLPAGAPTIPLSRIQGLLVAADGDTIVANAQFQGDSAILVFDVQFAGGSQEFNLDLTAYDANGQIVYHASTTVTLRPGRNTAVPAPVLIYSAPDASVTTIHVAPGSMTLKAGGTGSLSVTGTDASGKSIAPIHVGWQSRDPSIATVDANGSVLAGSSQGTTWIVARTATNVADSAQVMVHAPVASITISPDTAQVARHGTDTLTATLNDAGGHPITDRTATWTSSDTTIATVSASGVVSGIKFGTATITATAEGKSATAQVSVVSPVDHIVLSPASLTMNAVGESRALTAQLVPHPGASLTGITPTFTSSNARVATVDASGAVKAVSNGTATITAAVDSVTATATVTVQQVAVSITVSPATAGVSALGSSAAFTAAALDSLGAKLPPSAISWTSSNPNVATVDSTGVATGKSAGTATITAATANGKSFAATFIVSQTPVFILITSDHTQLQVGQTATLGAQLADANGNAMSPVTATWATTTPQIATLSADGHLTGVSGGTAHVTATANGLSGAINILVQGPTTAGGLVLNLTSAEKLPNGTQQFTVESGGSGPFTWTVNGIPGGNSTYGTIDETGFYTAPAAVPSPSTFNVCAVQASPAAQGCAQVTIDAIPTAGGEVVVINDMNLMQDSYITANDNRTFFKNIVGFTPVGARSGATVVMFQYGHNSLCGGQGQCAADQTTTLRSDMLTAGITSVTDDQSPTVNDIPSNVKALFLMNPTTYYSVDEVNALKTFAAQGGRIVFIGENGGYYGSGIPIENQLLADLGGQLTNTAALASCSYGWTVDASHLRPHQITTGVNSLNIPCASPIVLGPNDYAIAYGQADADGTYVPVIAIAKIDFTLVSGIRKRVPSLSAPKTSPTRKSAAGTQIDTTGLGPGVKKP